MARPAPVAPAPGDEAYNLIPQGVDEDGNVLHWDIGGPFAHFLRAGRTRTGKSLDINTYIPTVAGWITMGNLQVGDQIFDENGQPTTVTGVYDQPPDRPCVEVTFSDGSRITCDEQHLWWTETRAARISSRQSRTEGDRRTTLTPALVADLRRRASASRHDDTLSVSEVARLRDGEVSQVGLGDAARGLTAVDVVSHDHWFSYPEQTVRQRQKVLVYDAQASYQAIAALARSGRFPQLKRQGEVLEKLAAEPSDSASLTSQQLANSLGVPTSQAARWLQLTGLPARREVCEIELTIAAKRVRRAGRPGRRFHAVDLFHALADAGTRIINDQRHRHIHGSVKETHEIADTLHTCTGHLNHSIPVAAGLQLPDVELSVPPYTLGAFLGDGSSYSARLTSADPEVVARIEADGFEVVQVKLRSDAWNKCRDYKILELRPELKKLGVLRRRQVGPSAKRVPAQYLRASERQRRALLAGLLDTDGTVSAKGTVQYTTILPGLAEDVLELAISLGYLATSIESRATLNGRDIGPKWTIAFTTTDPVFGLTRKLDAQQQRTAHHSPERVCNRMIVSVRPVPSVPLRCITVDSPNRLYLAGRSMIPTHNTVTVIGDAIECARREMPVFVIDPKRVEFMGLRTWPNVQYVATTVQQQIALVHMLKKEMDERYRLVEEEGFSDSQFQPILVIIDEYRQLYGNIQAWWKSIKVTGMPAECPIFEWIGGLLRMAAYCRIHVDLATQRPDAAFLGGEALAVDTPIPTPTGWSTMGDLRAGQEVFDEQGCPTRVVDATEVMVDRPCFRVTFSDHSTLVADRDHLWAAHDYAQRASDSLAARSLRRDELYPEHASLAVRLAVLPGTGPDVTVREFEDELGGGRIGLLRRGLNDGRWALRRTGTRPGGGARFPARTYDRATLLTALHTECVSDASTWRRTGPQTVTTGQLADTVHTPTGHPNWSIATTRPLSLPEVDLPIDPWLLGYWLGDGQKAAATIATADVGVLDRMRSLRVRVTHYGRCIYKISTGPRGGWARPSLQRSLRELGLLDNKHVPQMYLRASERQRRELLAGLLDGDGSCAGRSRGTSSGQVVFPNTDRRLTDAVFELAASLGFVPTVRCLHEPGFETHPSSVAVDRPSKAAWIVAFTPSEQVFGISGKQEMLAPAVHSVPPHRRRHVVAVERVPSVPVRCITVAADSHLYLAGRAFIPTHNCRDNFSARAATGRLSPDGAEMMFDTVHVGVNIPMNVRGRGTIVGVDDQPKEVQFFYTPDPRRPRSDEDRELLDRLRPLTTRWPALTMSLPAPVTFADELPDGKKTNLEWEQLLRASFEPTGSPGSVLDGDDETMPEPVDGCALTEASRDDPEPDLDDLYSKPSPVPAGMVSSGDLLHLDADHGWVRVTDVAKDSSSAGHGEIQLEWTDDDGQVGDLIIGRGELLEIRRPQN